MFTVFGGEKFESTSPTTHKLNVVEVNKKQISYKIKNWAERCWGSLQFNPPSMFKCSITLVPSYLPSTVKRTWIQQKNLSVITLLAESSETVQQCSDTTWSYTSNWAGHPIIAINQSVQAHLWRVFLPENANIITQSTLIIIDYGIIMFIFCKAKSLNL